MERVNGAIARSWQQDPAEPGVKDIIDPGRGRFEAGRHLTADRPLSPKCCDYRPWSEWKTLVAIGFDSA
jgi:hypothetical protein